MSQAKNWCVTINNYTDIIIEELKAFIQNECSYGMFQCEIAPTTNTPHLQVFLQLKTKKRLSFIRGFFPTCHAEIARGTCEENRAYCSKPGGTNPYEHGVPTTAGRSPSLDEAIVAIKEKRSFSAVAEEYSEIWVRHHRGLLELASRLSPRRDFIPEVYWFYGATGTGKSREAAVRAPDAYYKMGGNKWWDGYDCHEAVIIDDYRRDLCTFSELLRMLDRYPYRIETKGGSAEFVARRIFITSPKNPQDTWEGRTEEDLAQLMRRITTVTHFSGLA